MKKWIALLLACLLLLTGCNKEDGVSDSLREEIQRAYRKEFNPPPTFEFKNEDDDTIAGMQYYGTYNGYVVLFDEGPLCVMSSEKIGNETFKWGSNFSLYAYKDGQFHELSDVYDEGHINDGQIAQIAQVHKDYFSTRNNWDYDMEE